MNPLELFLNRVERELRSMPKWKKEEELRELRSHLEQRVEDFEREGSKPEEAQARAVAGFGSARALGSQLCDAWEGIPFSWWRVAGSVVGATLFWFGGNIALIYWSLTLFLWPQSVLFPELFGVWLAILAAIPLSCGALLSLWLGRRGRLIGAACIFFFEAIRMLSGLLFLSSALTINGNRISMLPLNVLLCVGGAGLVQGLRTRRLKLAFVDGRNVAVYASFKSAIRAQVKPLVKVTAISSLLAGAGAARFYLTLHPTTPIAALRNSLLVERGTNNYEYEPPKILGLRELPAQTPAERAGRERRVEFKIEAHATKDYATRRVAYYQKELASPFERKSYGEKPLRLSLARMERNRQIVQGVARLVNTPSGWQVDEKSFDRSRLWSWAEDVYFEH